MSVLIIEELLLQDMATPFTWEGPLRFLELSSLAKKIA